MSLLLLLRMILLVTVLYHHRPISRIQREVIVWIDFILARECAALSRFVLKIRLQINSLCGKLQGQTQAPPTITATTIERKRAKREKDY